MPDNSIDTLITDPPAGINFMGKEWDGDKGGRKQWIEWLSRVMAECLRVCKPGATALVWSIPRTSHWTATALEDAGWEIRDCVYHIFGTGFPKSHDIGKAIDKAAGVEREVIGTKVVGGTPGGGRMRECNLYDRGDGKTPDGRDYANARAYKDARQFAEAPITAPATDLAKQFDGYGTALKPAVECWWLCQKPIESTFAANAEKWGVAGLWIDGGRVETDDYLDRPQGTMPQPMDWGNKSGEGGSYWTTGHNGGRWPANLVLDELAAGLVDEQSGITHSRFFYTAKASKGERGKGNNHPTVKSIELCRYLCRLTKTPSGGVVLDPFMGSGSIGVAAITEGRGYIGIELKPEYFKIAESRLANTQPPLPGVML